MDEGKLVVEFVAANLDKILSVAREAIGEINHERRVKLRATYTNYLTNARLRYSKAKSFFVRNRPTNLYDYYVPVSLQCDSITIPEPSPSACFEQAKRIVISGSGGCGKSVLMRHLFLSSIRDTTYVPVLIELRDLNSTDANISDLICDTLNRFGLDTSERYLKKALEAGHFALFLDGIDEVFPSQRAKLIDDVSDLSVKYPQCPIVLSTRPDDEVQSLDEFMIFAMRPLNLCQAVNLIRKLPYDNEIQIKFADDLQNGLFEQHQSFLSNPLLLSIMLLTYGENAEIPQRRSVFYNQAYEALFQRHDASKGGFRREKETELDIHDFARVFALFCLQTYERRLFKMSRVQALEFIGKSKTSLGFQFSPEAYLRDLLSATCLLVDDGLEVMYTHRSFQEYFVAQYIISVSDEIQKRLLQRYCKFGMSDNVIDLVQELNLESLERNLLIPKLVEVFSKLQVSSGVGISHATRYLRLVYSKIEISKVHSRASLRGEEEGGIASVLYLAVRICDTYIFPGSEYFAEQHGKLVDKHSETFERLAEDGMLTLEGSEIRYQMPLMRDILEGEGVFSIRYVRAGHRALKLLQKKHAESMETLDKLLNF